MKLQPGDYVSTEGMTEEEYHAVCRAFIEAGAEGSRAESRSYTKTILWDKNDNTLWTSCHDVGMLSSFISSLTCRELTKDQILGAQKMTKVTVFGQEEARKEEKKIEFTGFVTVDSIVKASNKPSCYDNVCLLGKFTGGIDVMMAWDDRFEGKDIYLGHWNDGVV